ncbi:hypothetical protein EDEG_00126 [Edhazardia aedis USNM 41457]|uniref:Homeobox domain-containing protein n=1 Tax=Edhazardia aedis (strain USNM 41457) TaxID=1003232 RepID=J9DAV9_EDHAE|nr:hypothetical protein EDEG_00126 [Edhazardia aedis USNM 41457]|eukprot:EJW04906.1 hypothetical protein EDEG_00126 [Edhazardia aedis USNM 41457]
MDDETLKETANKIAAVRKTYTSTGMKINETIDLTQKLFSKNIFLVRPVVTTDLVNFYRQKIEEIQKNGTEAVESLVENYVNEVEEDVKDALKHGKRKRYNKRTRFILESFYAKERYPTDQDRINIALACNLTPKQVGYWFTNKRNKYKK